MFKPNKRSTTIDFCLASTFFLNLEHLPPLTLVLLFTLCYYLMLAESTQWIFCQNNTVMLTYTQNHGLEILFWRCSCHRNEKQSSKSFFKYDANLLSVITIEWLLSSLFFFFAMLLSPYDVISCDVINVENLCEILRYFLKILATP